MAANLPRPRDWSTVGGRSRARIRRRLCTAAHFLVCRDHVDRVELPLTSLSTGEIYSLMVDLVAPRPIAWVSTCDGEGRGNLAPFSYYQAVSSAPATIVLGIAWRADGTTKDTLANILETREFTVNHVSAPLAEVMNRCSAELSHERSEWQAFGVEAEAAASVRPPRVSRALAGFECRLTHAIPLGQTRKKTPSSTLVIAEVVHMFVAKELVTRAPNGKIQSIDPGALAAVGRLGGSTYTHTSDRFVLVRPNEEE